MMTLLDGMGFRAGEDFAQGGLGIYMIMGDGLDYEAV